VFVGYREAEAWVFNASGAALVDLQLRLPEGARCTTPGAAQHGAYLRLPAVPAGAAGSLAFDRPVRFAGPRTVRLDAAGRGRLGGGAATVYLNAGADAWMPAGGSVPAGGVLVVPEAGWAPEEALAVAPQAERLRLFSRQFGIIARELATRKRSLSTERFLGAETIPLEDHANW
jgi:hypothetical protein